MHTILKSVTHPLTQKKIKTVVLNDGRTFRYNSVYKVFNCSKNYDQLTTAYLPMVNWESSK